MPAVFNSLAGTSSAFSFSLGMNFSDSLLTPPPITMRSGQRIASTLLVVALKALRPFAEGEALLVLDAGRGPRFGVVAVHLDVAELGVGDQDAAIDDRRADPGAQSGEQYESGVILGRAVVHLGDAGGIRVVDQHDVATEMIFEDLLGLAVDPRLVDVGGRPGHAVGDDRRDGHADRPVADRVGEVGHDLPDDLRDVRRRRLGRCRNAHPLARQLTRGQVDRGTLDAAAADVDAEYGSATYGFVAYGLVGHGRSLVVALEARRGSDGLADFQP